MKLKNIKEVEAFRKVIHECEGDVYLKSPEGDVFNLKSSLSEYIALGRLLGEAGDSLELFASRREDEARLIAFLKEQGIQTVFHYIPLHTAPAGQKFGRFNGEDRYTTKESERLLRLPMYYGLKEEQVQYIAGKVREFYGK